MIFDDDVTVDYLPYIWKEKYKNYLGKEPENDSRSILQDVHWSTGSFGYFPTYSLGTFYSVQFYEKLKAECPELLKNIDDNNLIEIKNWLNIKIHKLGSDMNSEEICKQVTGEGLNIDYFIKYINQE